MKIILTSIYILFLQSKRAPKRPRPVEWRPRAMLLYIGSVASRKNFETKKDSETLAFYFCIGCLQKQNELNQSEIFFIALKANLPEKFWKFRFATEKIISKDV